MHTTWVAAALMVVSVLTVLGCGTTREQKATEQLVMSDAVDRSVQGIDFRPLSDQKVYLDNSYLRHVKGESFVNSEYVTSALRQQIVAAGCLIQDTPQDADVIIEARLGVLGADDHRVTFGLPENNALASAISLLPNAPKIPAIPEIALARREAREASAKVVAFAYHRETRKPLWQSGVKYSQATARDTWVLGIGPFQGGSIRDETKLAGSEIAFRKRDPLGSPADEYQRPTVDYASEMRFDNGWPVLVPSKEKLGQPRPELVPPGPPALRDIEIAEDAASDTIVAEGNTENIQR